VRRLVAAFNSLELPHTGSLLPGWPRCACSQALVSPENGSKLPSPGQNTIFQSGDESPHSKRALQVLNQAKRHHRHLI